MIFVRRTRRGRKRACRQVQALRGRFAALDTFIPRLPAHTLAGVGRGSLRQGTRSKAARRPEAQRHKKGFSVPHDFSACRHTAETLHAQLSGPMLHGVFPIHGAFPLSGVQMPASSCAHHCRPCLALHAGCAASSVRAFVTHHLSCKPNAYSIPPS